MGCSVSQRTWGMRDIPARSALVWANSRGNRLAAPGSDRAADPDCPPLRQGDSALPPKPRYPKSLDPAPEWFTSYPAGSLAEWRYSQQSPAREEASAHDTQLCAFGLDGPPEVRLLDRRRDQETAIRLLFL